MSQNNASSAAATGRPAIDFRREARKRFPDMVAWRRDFHQNPELGFHEIRTSQIIADTLARNGLAVTRAVGQTGVVGLLEGAKSGPTVLLRFDMDALPIVEENPAPYRSHAVGKMHACGHDGHMAMGLALASLFSAYQDRLAGRIKFLFQPAEEGLGGAFAMIADGVLKNPRPDVALAMHLWSELPLGQARVTDGPCMAASSTFTLTVSGTGGHGAAPHKAQDPILAAAHIITALQSIVSRNVDPLASGVVTVSQIEAGTAFNVIPEKATLRGTVRSYKTELHRQIYRRILEMARSVAAAFGCSINMETLSIVPPVVNAPEPARRVRQAASHYLGAENVRDERDMASEDMGFFLEEIPGCYFFVGAQPEDPADRFPHHHPRFDFAEAAMINGVAIMADVAGRYLIPGFGAEMGQKVVTAPRSKGYGV